ncbi:MAG: MBL fold metallo-hydrolase [Candidatus Nanohaloarchaea archaeon]|nr:MBL fold metallo-hydrolase [Candidatus Nanohaloarchaea archaeon]
MNIHTVSGYEEVGKNMTAVESDGEVVLIDMGADMETVVEYEESLEEMSTSQAIEIGAAPDDSRIKEELREDVVGIVVSHGHLDHCLALPKIAGAYDCPIYATPFTAKVVERIIEQDDEEVRNEVVPVNLGDTAAVSDSIELEMVNITHSIPHTPLTVLHTDEGTVAYSLDFKLDEEPTMGGKPDYKRIRELGEDGVTAYIADSTRTDEQGRTKSERETAIELRNILNKAYQENEGVIVSTFSSHIARVNNILDANAGRRRVALVGRSLKEYTQSADELGLIDLNRVDEVVSYRDEVEEFLQQASNEKEDWLIICTGHQGEPNAVLTRIAEGEYHYDITEDDRVVFSSTTIPVPVNEANRYSVEKTMRENGARVEVDVHSHGHGMREDQRDMLRMLDPDHVIPAHGTTEKLAACASLAMEEGYVLEEDVHISQNGHTVEIS